MSRFYDRVLEDGIHPPPAAQGIGVSSTILADLQRAEVVKIDNVARWIYSGTDQEQWSISQDFPVILSPFESAWYEWHHNGFVRSEEFGNYWQTPVTMGFLVRVFERGDYTQTFEQDILHYYRDQRGVEIRPKWIQESLCFIDGGKGKPARGPLGAWRVPIAQDGSMCCAEGTDQAAYEIYPIAAKGKEPSIARAIETGLAVSTFPMYMAISLMHCKNVTRIAHEIPDDVQKRRQRKKRPELSRYYTLEIDAFKEDVRVEGGAKSGGIKRAIHRRRGHFKHYTPDRPLFGKHVGRWFWGNRLVGTPELGEVNKDYSPKAPA